MISCCNDIFSYEKERAAGADSHNLAVAIAAETGMDELSALVAFAHRFNDALDAFLQLDQNVLTGGDPQVARYVIARRYCVRATYDWGMKVPRYH